MRKVASPKLTRIPQEEDGVTGTTKKIVKSHHGIRLFDLPNGTKLSDMRTELFEMTDVLMGRADPPIDVGAATMMEVAEAYHARASEMEMMIHAAEADGSIERGSPPYKFRTGILRTFQEMTKKTIDLGSRRITLMQVEHSQRERDV